MKKSVVYEMTASLDVDPQKSFTSACPLELPIESGHVIAKECNENVLKATYRLLSKDAHPLSASWVSTVENPQFTKIKREANVDMYWNAHCIVGTPGFELIEGFPHVSTYDLVIYKGVERDMHPYSPIYHDLEKKVSTGIIEFARSKGVDTFILGGLSLDFCLGEAAFDLKEAGFRVIVNLGATRAIGSQEDFIVKAEKVGIEFVNSASEISSEDFDLPF